jgi:hypothetical protein
MIGKSAQRGSLVAYSAWADDFAAFYWMSTNHSPAFDPGRANFKLWDEPLGHFGLIGIIAERSHRLWSKAKFGYVPSEIFVF